MMKIVSWNVNGIRTFKNLKQTLDELEADVICLQETKVTRDMIDEPTALIDGYNAYFSFSRNKSGYSGVATYCREIAMPICAEEGLSGCFQTNTLETNGIGLYEGIDREFTLQELKRLDSEGRAIITQHKIKKEDGSESVVTVFNVYCPRADPEKTERLQFKLQFYKLLELRATAVSQSGSHVIVVGDINTSHRQIDRCENVDQDEFDENPSRQWLNSFLVDMPQNYIGNVPSVVNTNSFQMVDSFRFFHPHTTDAFTCWNTKVNARATNYGSRIDYIFVDQLLIPSMKDSLILSEVLGSDHCPVVGSFNIKPIKATRCPTACIKNFPEFSGVQQKLSCFFEKKAEGSTSAAESIPTKRKYPENHQGCDKNKIGPVSKKIKTQGSSTQKQIMSFFQKSTNVTTEALDSTSSVSSSQGSSDSHESSFYYRKVNDSEATLERSEKSSSVISAWRNMLTGPRPPPLCKGHKESCVERTVKKKGPNFNKKFFACARGEGSKTDPRARCDHFEWAQKK